MTTADTICFRWEHLLAFRQASSDINPLHIDPEYARQTHFGGPVVFVALGAIATILRLPPALNPQRPAAGPRGSSNT